LNRIEVPEGVEKHGEKQVPNEIEIPSKIEVSNEMEVHLNMYEVV